MKKFRIPLCAAFAVALLFYGIAEAVPDLLPPVGSSAIVTGTLGSTTTIYKSQKVYDQLQSGQSPSWDNSNLSIVENGAKAKVIKHPSDADFYDFLVQIQIQTGKHAGQSWWIHARDLKGKSK